MTLLAPLGLIALIGIIILIIIYIIRPNYQQKMVSSTFVWKLSLKYRKKKIPTSKLRDLLIIICQILILATCAFIIAKPALVIKAEDNNTEVVVILDASASMKTENENHTRFSRAVDQAINKVNDVFDDNGYVTVILAGKTAKYVAQRETKVNQKDVVDGILALVAEGNEQTVYGDADIEGAFALCEETIADNPKANVFLYTDANYSYVPKGVTVVNVASSNEWNASILNAYAELYQNFYVFTVEVACYGRDESVDLYLYVNGANATEENPYGSDLDPFTVTVPCINDEVMKVVFRYDYDGEEYGNTNLILANIPSVWSFNDVTAVIESNDSFEADDYYYIYAGKKQELRVQYATTFDNNFMNESLEIITGAYSTLWDIKVDTVICPNGQENYSLADYDIYIFEHFAPKFMPNDGIAFLFDPKGDCKDGGYTMDPVNGDNYQLHSNDPLGDYLTTESNSPLLNYIDVEDLTVSNAGRITGYDETYSVLMELGGYPVAIARNNGREKSVVFSFSVHYSNIGITGGLVTFLYNMISYYLPSTITANTFEVYEKVAVNGRGEKLKITGSDMEKEIEEFPTTVVFDVAGAYTLSQTTYFEKDITEKVFIRIPNAESNIFMVKDALEDPFTQRDDSDYFKDLLLYLAIALVTLLFVEWWLHSRESM